MALGAQNSWICSFVIGLVSVDTVNHVKFGVTLFSVILVEVSPTLRYHLKYIQEPLMLFDLQGPPNL